MINIVSNIVLNFVFSCMLPVYRNTIYFYLFGLFPAAFMNSLISPSVIVVLKFLGIFNMGNHLSLVGTLLGLPFTMYAFSFLFLLYCADWNSSTVLSKSSEEEASLPYSQSWEKHSVFHL